MELKLHSGVICNAIKAAAFGDLPLSSARRYLTTRRINAVANPIYDIPVHTAPNGEKFSSVARLRTAFGDEVSCKTTIYNWFVELKRGRVNLSDEFRDGRPSTAVNNKKHRCCEPYARNRQRALDENKHLGSNRERSINRCAGDGRPRLTAARNAISTHYKEVATHDITVDGNRQSRLDFRSRDRRMDVPPADWLLVTRMLKDEVCPQRVLGLRNFDGITISTAWLKVYRIDIQDCD
ncbi:hypothetical protein EVAR_11812_1 [Eumeta japonica]|uniref:Mos1 transposase HTH domain-containing protein n=1 Tax=Eumeta variegata TaxID=151549 RepID=A0A4C1UPU3_EUMVA|nr:hypothetical protein EVAR_11812_1 [Eumeta japonica]